jgi:enoyl-CoA hydratase/carnithine racemase
MEICTSGRIVKGAEALRIGLLNAILPSENFTELAITWCSKIARHPSPGVLAAKQAINTGLRLPLTDGLAFERRLFVELNQSDGARGLNAESPKSNS